MAQGRELGHPFFQKTFLIIFRWVIKLLLRLTISGVENLPRSGPLILIINHIAFSDPFICSALPRFITPIAKKEAFANPFFRWMMNRYGTIPITRGEADITALKLALRVLKREGTILLAPEGTRSPTHQLQPAKPGAVMLAVRSGAPVVPVGITGTHQLVAHWRRGRRAPVHLALGQPFYIRPATGNGRPQRAEMEQMTAEMMYRLAAQLPPEYRGVYSDLSRATATTLTPLTALES